MTSVDRTLLTFGVVLIIVAVAIVLAITVIGWGAFIPLVLVICGFVVLGLAVARSIQPLKYEYGAFETAIFGVGLLTAGGAWYLFSFNWLYSLVAILLAIAGVAIAAALKRK